MIIVEGMDNSGKTTLVEKLHKEYNLSVIKSSGPKDMSQLESAIYDSIERFKNGDIVIYDRHPIISEHVYGPVLRNKNLLENLARKKRIWDDFFRVEPMIIYCRPPIERIRNYGEREQMDGVKENTELLTHAYDIVMNKIRDHYRKNFIHYNFEKHKDEDIFKEVKYYLIDTKIWRGENG